MSDVPVRREVIVVPGGSMTVTVFHFGDRRAVRGTAIRDRTVQPLGHLLRRALRWLAAR